jgi:hypothetical protein
MIQPGEMIQLQTGHRSGLTKREDLKTGLALLHNLLQYYTGLMITEVDSPAQFAS